MNPDRTRSCKGPCIDVRDATTKAEVEKFVSNFLVHLTRR
jgi:hypothetical protein